MKLTVEYGKATVQGYDLTFIYGSAEISPEKLESFMAGETHRMLDTRVDAFYRRPVLSVYHNNLLVGNGICLPIITNDEFSFHDKGVIINGFNDDPEPDKQLIRFTKRQILKLENRFYHPMTKKLLDFWICDIYADGKLIGRGRICERIPCDENGQPARDINGEVCSAEMFDIRLEELA